MKNFAFTIIKVSSVLFSTVFTISYSHAQNVGIGTTTPTQKLEVVGAVKSDSLLVIKGTSAAGVFGSSPNIHVDLENPNGGSVVQRLFSSGNGGKEIIMGINPTANTNGIFLLSNGSGSNFFLMDPVNGNFGLGGMPTATDRLSVNGNQGIGIAGAGGPGVFGTNTANTALHLTNSNSGNSVIQTFSTSSKEIIMGINPTYNTNGIFLISNASGNNYFVMDAVSGEVAISATPSTANKLTVGGSIGATAFNVTSDARLKTNILPVTHVLGQLMSLNAYTYNFVKTHPSGFSLPTDKRQIGVMAQEVEAQFPELVTTDANGYKAVDYTKLSALLLQAMKEQQQDIDELKKMVIELKNSKKGN